MLNNILIIDDHPSVREGMKSLFQKKRVANEIIEAGSFEDGFKAACRNNPELILMDISLHGASGIELARKIIEKNPSTKIVMLSMYSKIHYIVESLKVGAKGYLLKESPSERIYSGIEKILSGEIYVDSHVSGKVISSLMGKNQSQLAKTPNSYDALSFREQEILRLLAEGIEVKSIADQLHISEKTVINHRTNIMTKLECKNIVELIRYAVHIGLIDI